MKKLIWVLNEGVRSGATVITRNENPLRKNYICGSLHVVVENDKYIVSITSLN